MTPDKDITVLLNSWQAGDEQAFEKLCEHVYSELRRLAQVHLRKERQNHTLQATALVNEVLLKIKPSLHDYQSRAQFYGMASRMMRNLLVDHARRYQRDKRGGGAAHLTLAEGLIQGADMPLNILDLDRALTKLTSFDTRKAEVIQLNYFGGLRNDEIADCLDVSLRTVERDIRLARAWLHRELAPGSNL